MGRILDLMGRRFKFLTVVAYVGLNKHKQASWMCRCDCGRERVIHGSALILGKRKSCGCKNSEPYLSDRLKPLYPVEYAAWVHLRQRCSNSKNPKYKDYGGRGISVCDRWTECFQNFIDDMGVKPSPKHSLDRIDNDGNYEPGNCRWATAKEQRNNQRRKSDVESRRAT